MTNNGSLQICTTQPRVKNLESATETRTVAGDMDTKGRIIEYLFYLKKQGRRPYTQLAHRKALYRLAKHGANLLDPESVKETISNETVADSTKLQYVGIYTVFARYFKLSWEPPIYKATRKLPFIPLETEIDQLTAGFKRRVATFLQVLKETGARCGEAWALEWTDINGNILTINVPEKDSLPRQLKISEKLVSMLQSLPKKDKRIFGPQTCLNNLRGNYIRKRKAIARTLCNPRLERITFHTLRHFYATMLYAKTKNILLVQQKLGHKSIENTMVYTQLICFESDEYNTATATKTSEAETLVQAGFDYVCTTTDNIMLFRKRK
jgi:integrase